MSDEQVVEIRAYEPAHEPEVLRVLQSAFGGWPGRIEGVKDPAEFFRWKMTECPFGPSVSLVALCEQQVIGFLGQLRWPLRVKGQTVLSTRGVDLAVDPSHRRRGVSVAMARWAIEHNPHETALAWNNPNDQSRPGLMKTGRRKIVMLPSYAQWRGAFGQTFRRASGKGSRTPDHLPVDADTAAAVLSDGDYITQLLSEVVEPDDRLATARNLDYLRWRYGRFGRYHAFRCEERLGVPGIAIFRLHRGESLWVAEVCELLVAGDERAAKRSLLAKIRRSAAVDLISANFDSRLEALRHGFPRVSGGTLVTARKIEGGLSLDPTERAAWALSLGDVDLL